jgi:hypothetical protein
MRPFYSKDPHVGKKTTKMHHILAGLLTHSCHLKNTHAVLEGKKTAGELIVVCG